MMMMSVMGLRGCVMAYCKDCRLFLGLCMACGGAHLDLKCVPGYRGRASCTQPPTGSLRRREGVAGCCRVLKDEQTNFIKHVESDRLDGVDERLRASGPTPPSSASSAGRPPQTRREGVLINHSKIESWRSRGLHAALRSFVWGQQEKSSITHRLGRLPRLRPGLRPLVGEHRAPVDDLPPPDLVPTARWPSSRPRA